MSETLIVGLGSPHGDDQVGWRIAELLAAESRPGWAVRMARSPAELFEWLDGGVENLVICDACCSSRPPGEILTWRWPTPEIKWARSSGSHDLSLPSILELAKILGRLPRRVYICAMETMQRVPGAKMSRELASALPTMAARIRGLCERASSSILSTDQPTTGQRGIW